MALIVCHNDESVREGYIRNGGKEVKLFTSALKAFQCYNRIVMSQRKHLDDFLRGRIIGRLECGRIQLEVSETFNRNLRALATFKMMSQALECLMATRVGPPSEGRETAQPRTLIGQIK
ncbi:transposable element Tcb1 transposase [Trichonephila clavipes]|nr:transposable element Tcb1 transposase [Trichonephila clavipes]